MEIKYKNIILRDMIPSDIEDNVRWDTTETEWSDYDAPWEPVGGEEASERESWTRYYEAVRGMAEKAIRWRFEIEWEGRHIGWVSSYLIDENYEWIAFSDVQEGQTVYRAVGIDICESDCWGQGVGTNALRAFIQYYFHQGFDTLYTQTWSGNSRMIHCAEKQGFAECCRRVGIHEVRGKRYDELTFRLNKTVSAP